MRQKSITVYTFSELSDDSKQRASDYINSEYFSGDDGLASLRAFTDYFGAKVTNYEYGAWSYCDISTDAEPSNFRGLTLKKARQMPEFLTGYCLDCELRDWFIKEFERTGDAFAAFIDAMDNGIRWMGKDWEDQCSEEATAEHCEANGYEFYENGGLA